MILINEIEKWHNKASDTRFVWLPFIFLKPRAEEPIGRLLKLKMILCFGLYFGFLSALRKLLFYQGDFVEAFERDSLLWAGIFALWFNLVTAPLWNRRARRLLAQQPLASSEIETPTSFQQRE